MRRGLYRLSYWRMVATGGIEPHTNTLMRGVSPARGRRLGTSGGSRTRTGLAHLSLNQARLPFRHARIWRKTRDSNPQDD